MSGVNKVTIVAFVMMLCILLQTNISKADTFLAGDANGWGFKLNGWPNGKTFKTGDYGRAHNVVKVDQAGFDSCNGAGGQVFASGDDKITLTQGTSYFICTIGPHCANGVKATVTAN
ncbi:hypothetical protein H5410_010789 [Solanum commersonii]|uniref:Phytocyanin domain-containing protein n=1 Tax=Solanum commersonii TaxID=4109 RepID=A0A9J6AMS6_SOLCO|nr:hypothetical protein H5410_010789 [Solanum commersonii]